MARRSKARLGGRRARSGFVRALAWLGFVLAAAAVIALGALGWLMMAYPNRKGPGQGKLVAIEIDPGIGLSQVAFRLAAQGALEDPVLFALHAKLRGAAPRLRSGEVLVYDSMTPRQLLQRIARGFGSAELRVVIPEGFSSFEIGDRLERFAVCDKAEFLAATRDPNLLRELAIAGSSAEGYLFPDTYLLSADMDPHVVVRRFVKNANRRLELLESEQKSAFARLHDELGFGLEQIVILASIVEKEAAQKREQPIIAGVFWNRLRDAGWKPRRLQADPTVAYGCLLSPQLASCAGFDGRTLTRAMLADSQNAYNTYRLEGLPPGPISNPGLSALRAVLSPATHDYFYFVAKGGGAHEFSHDLEAHNAAVQQLRNR